MDLFTFFYWRNIPLPHSELLMEWTGPDIMEADIAFVQMHGYAPQDSAEVSCEAIRCEEYLQ